MNGWQERVMRRIRQAPSCALFLDFDGTLAEFTNEPRTCPTSRPFVRRVKA